MGDDAVGLIAGRKLHSEFGASADYTEVFTGGIDLLEIVSGYTNVLLLDAVMTGRAPVGTVHELSKRDFENVTAPSPHAAGLPEVFQLAEQLHLPMPEQFRILAIEVGDVSEIREGLGNEIMDALDGYLQKARSVLRGWIH